MLIMTPMATDRFHFDCPRCGERCSIALRERDTLVQCGSCRLEFPGPLYSAAPGAPRPRSEEQMFECACPHCGKTRRQLENAHAVHVACTACGNAFAVPKAPWAHWRRPVAKVFTHHDLSYSLHHLMMDVRRWIYPDHRLSPRARRSFEFYCGACGRLQKARVWDIASQTPCQFCNELMIVPSPRHAPRGSAAADAPDRLYCPQCGQIATLSDKNRRRNSYCAACGLWF